MTTPRVKLQETPKAMWLAALRSGDYIQAQGQLRKTDDGVDSHCCLGVLEDVYRKFEGAHFGPDTASTGYPSNDATEWAFGLVPGGNARRLFSVDPTKGDRLADIVGDEGRTNIATLNDSRKLSFKQIANRIERSL